MEVKAAMLQAIALVQKDAGLPVCPQAGGIQVSAVGLPCNRP